MIYQTFVRVDSFFKQKFKSSRVEKFFVIAASFDEAEQKLQDYIDDLTYDDRNKCRNLVYVRTIMEVRQVDLESPKLRMRVII